MSLPEPELLALFGPQGPLRHAAPGYRERPGQVALAQAISQTLDASGCLVAEAGTGVGKTFAYLVPLLRHAGKTVISTATRHLQDQLYTRDLPRIKAALGVSIQTAILKGRSNYLCLYRLEQHQAEGRFHRREDIAAFREIVRFAATTTHGDIAECDAVPESSPVWASATSTRENCLGQQCPRLADCHVMAARQRAADADLYGAALVISGPRDRYRILFPGRRACDENSVISRNSGRACNGKRVCARNRCGVLRSPCRD